MSGTSPQIHIAFNDMALFSLEKINSSSFILRTVLRGLTFLQLRFVLGQITLLSIYCTF